MLRPVQQPYNDYTKLQTIIPVFPWYLEPNQANFWQSKGAILQMFCRYSRHDCVIWSCFDVDTEPPHSRVNHI